MAKLSYEKSGVNVKAGDALVDWLALEENKKPLPHADKIVSGIGGFASLFRASFSQYKKPCLVTCTDGVGTKVKLAAQFKRFEGIGQDLVAMCVNDLICTGGDPLLFLDYYATAKLNLDDAKVFLKSVREACRLSDCALVGGETAEMPGVYAPNDFDCAGFAVGVVDEEKAWGSHLVKEDDQVLGISSSGFHSNGYSLLRKVFEKDLSDWVEVLLKPTALYVKLIQELKTQIEIHAAAHITGGGIENVNRVLPPELCWKMKTWQWPQVFNEVQKRCGLTPQEMQKTLNCGIGFVLVLPASQVVQASAIIQEQGYQVYDLGSLHAE